MVLVSPAIQFILFRLYLFHLVKPLLPQGLFISSIKPKASKTSSNTWHHLPHSQPNLSHFPRQNNSQIFPSTAKPDTSILPSY